MKIIFIKLVSFALEKVMKGISLFTILCLLVLTSATAYCGEAAPYTEEAVQKVEMAAKRIDPPKLEKNISNEETQRRITEHMRKVYNEAGYSYDATIIKIADDMKNHQDRIPKDKITIVNHVVVGLHFMMSQCNNTKVDCLKYFPYDTAEAIRTLMKITSFQL